MRKVVWRRVWIAVIVIVSMLFAAVACAESPADPVETELSADVTTETTELSTEEAKDDDAEASDENISNDETTDDEDTSDEEDGTSDDAADEGGSEEDGTLTQSNEDEENSGNAQSSDQNEEVSDDIEDERGSVSASKCYALLDQIGGVACVTGEPVISTDGESYTIVFRYMTSEEYDAAMRLWRGEGSAVSWDSGTQIICSRVIEGKGFSFNVTVEGRAEPYEMTVRVQGAFA